MLNIFIKKRVSLSKIYRRIIPYEEHADVDDLNKYVIGGFLVEIGEVDEEDPRFKAYILQKSYQNFINAIYRVKIPITLVYSILQKSNELIGGFYILTKAKNDDELERRLKIIESTLYAVFPTYNLRRLSGNEIKEVLILGHPPNMRKNINPPPIIYEQNLPTNSPVVDSPKFYLPILETSSNMNTIRLGKVIKDGEESDIIYSISENEIRSHLVCLGATGSGKTTTVSTILNQLPQNIRYLVFDFHNEYARLLKNYTLILRPGKDSLSAINPLDVSYASDIGEHIALIADIFGDTYNFTHPQTYLFKLAVEATLSNYKLYGEKEPNLRALIKVVEEYPIKSYYDHETKMALLRRLKPLTEGQTQKAFIGERYVSIKEIMENNTVIELAHLRETKMRQIYSFLLLKKIYDYKLAMGTQEFNHIIVLEEARYIVPCRRDYEQPSIAERMINELRKFGESIFIITQFPTQISKDTIKNAGLIIVHRISGLEDLRILQNIIPIENTQLNYLKKMETGEAIVKDPRYPLPVHIKIHPI